MGLAYSIDATGLTQLSSTISLNLANGGPVGGVNFDQGFPWYTRLGSFEYLLLHNPALDATTPFDGQSSGRDIWHDNETMSVVIKGTQFINDCVVAYGAYECEVFDYHNVTGYVVSYAVDNPPSDWGPYEVPTGIPLDGAGQIVRLSCWDGFVAILRARPLISPTIDGVVCPMRMPIELPAGPASASAAQLTAIADDSTIGIWDIDCVHNTLAQVLEGASGADPGDPELATLQISTFNLICVGFQRGDNDQDSDIMVGQTYVPAAYVFPIQIPYAGFIGDPPQYQDHFGGSPATIFGGTQPMVFSQAGTGLAYHSCGQYTWSAGGVTDRGVVMTQTGGRFIDAGIITDPTDPNTFVGIQELIGSFVWGAGVNWTPTSTFLQTPPLTDPAQAYVDPTSNNANPTKFYSVKQIVATESNVVGTSNPASLTEAGEPSTGPFVIGGEMMSKDGTNDTYPLYLYGRQGYGSKYIPLLVAFDGYPESNFAQEDTGTAYDLSGAYVSKVVLTTDGFARDPANTQALLPAYGVQYTAPTDLPAPVGAGDTVLLGDLVLLLVDNVTHGGDTYGEIYVSDFTSIETSPTRTTGAFGNEATRYMPVFPVMVYGGEFTTSTGIDPPVTWRGSFEQYRTFTATEEEEVAYLKEDDTEGITLVSGQPTIAAASLGFVAQPMGIAVNYSQRPIRTGFTFESLGVRGDATVFASTTIDAFDAERSEKSVILYGDADGGGPYCIALDPCSWYLQWNQEAVAPLTAPNVAWRGRVREISSDINAAHIIDPTSTTRQVLSASWDNDRDQWIFVTADTVNGLGFISFDSNFDESLDQTEFIDEHWNDFGEYLGGTGFAALPPTGAFIVNRGMTNELDGFLIGGSFDATQPMVTLESMSFVDDTPNTFTDFFPNIYLAGTTGRTTRVWVDYILFDGADSLIAVKLQELGLRVTVENVEWFKAKIISQGDLKMTQEEVEEWMESQKTEYKDMLRMKERQGRLKRRKRQVSAYLDKDLEDSLYGHFIDTEDLRPEEIEKLLKKIEGRPPPPEEEKEHFEQ